MAEGVKDSKIIEGARISKATADNIKYGEVTEEIDGASDSAEVAVARRNEQPTVPATAGH